MGRKAYVEVGNRCFCRCVTCNALDKPHPIMELKDFEVLCKSLSKNGFSKIRLAGMDPLTLKNFNDYIDAIHMHGMESELTTTLLTVDTLKLNTVANVNDLNISLSAVGKQRYREFYSIDRFHLFDQNIHHLLTSRDKLTTIVYTISKSNSGICSILEFVEYINGLVSIPYCHIEVIFFPEISYGETIDTIEQEKIAFDICNAIEELHCKSMFVCDFTGMPIRYCTIPQVEWYIKYDMSVYPCCLAGGEIGQNLEKELLLGKIGISSVDSDIKKILYYGDNEFPHNRAENMICNRCSRKYINKMRQLKQGEQKWK